MARLAAATGGATPTTPSRTKGVAKKSAAPDGANNKGKEVVREREEVRVALPTATDKGMSDAARCQYASQLSSNLRFG